jgi:hypothetical protein
VKDSLWTCHGWIGTMALDPNDIELCVHDEAPELLKRSTWAGITYLPLVVLPCTKQWSPHADPNDAVEPLCDELPEMDEADYVGQHWLLCHLQQQSHQTQQILLDGKGGLHQAEVCSQEAYADS